MMTMTTLLSLTLQMRRSSKSKLLFRDSLSGEPMKVNLSMKLIHCTVGRNGRTKSAL
jgi:hypothetical protein